MGSKMERLRRMEGLKNPDDIHNMDTYEDVFREIGALEVQMENDVDEKDLSNEQLEVLERIEEFCVDVSEEFRKEFASLLGRYRQERRNISQEIVDFLLQKKHDMPLFSVSKGSSALEKLKECGIKDVEDAYIEDQSFLVVFQLPKPLAQFWWKGGVRKDGDGSKDVGDTVIEWGHFYRETMFVIWEHIYEYQNKYGLDFFRINPTGDHDSKKYYYIFDVCKDT